MSEVQPALAYSGAALIAAWGVAHAAPTRRVIAGFDPITVDNRRVITQEWIAEAVAMWAAAAVVVVATAADANSGVASWVCGVVVVMLLSLAGLTAVTGARTHVIWFRLCPVLLTSSAALLIAAIAS